MDDAAWLGCEPGVVGYPQPQSPVPGSQRHEPAPQPVQSDAVQVTGAPATHAPAALQESPVVHRSPSSQGSPSGKEHVPVVSVSVSVSMHPPSPSHSRN